MKNIFATINNNTRQVKLSRTILGVKGENLQGNIVVDFEQEFVDGYCYLMYQAPNGDKGYITMEQDRNKRIYTIPIKSCLLQEVGNVELQVKITEESVDGIPIFKSDKFIAQVKDSINAEEEMPDEYRDWFDEANELLASLKGASGELTGIYNKKDESLTIIGLLINEE